MAAMPVIELNTEINAPIERVFDLCLSIDLHQVSTAKSNERIVAGVASGLIGLGETVTWEATHFLIRQRLSVRITKFQRPEFFEDQMIKGAFRRFTHEHFFEQAGSKIKMFDRFDFDSPFGFIGKFADRLFLEEYMRRLIIERNKVIKQTAESQEWKKFLK
ncbi:MAG: SRPBCC family protein [Limisphaerales bacterium]